MKKIYFSLITTGLFLFTDSTNAQSQGETTTLSLQQAIDYSYEHQKDMVDAQLETQIAKAKVKETTGIGLPQISANLDLKDYFVLNYLFPGEFKGGAPGTFVGFGINTPSYSAGASVQATQLLFDGSYLVGLKASKTYRELSEKNLLRTKIETAVAVSKAYYYVQVNNERIKLLDANVIRVQKLLNDTKALYDNGFVEKIDYDRVTLTFNNLTTEKENVSRLMLLSEYMLKFQVGMDIHSKIMLTDSLSAEQVKSMNADAQKSDVTGRIEYSILQTQQHLQQLDLKRYRSLYYPRLVLYGNLNTLAQRPKFDFTDSKQAWFPTGFVGLTLSLPLFDGLQREKKIDQAKLMLRKIDNQIANTTNALNLETEANQTALTNALAAFSTQEQNLELANEVVRVTKAKYDQGVGSNLEVITAETSLKEAQTNYYNSLYDALIAKVDLDKAQGKIK